MARRRARQLLSCLWALRVHCLSTKKLQMGIQRTKYCRWGGREARVMTARDLSSNPEQLSRIGGKKCHPVIRPTLGRQNSQKCKCPDFGYVVAGDAPGAPKGTQGRDMALWEAVGYYIGPY